MPLPDNYSSSAFNRAWGRDKIMPRALNTKECGDLAIIASAIAALRTCFRAIQLLPKPYHSLEWGPSDVKESLRADIASLKAAAKDIERIPQVEADKANDQAALDA